MWKPWIWRANCVSIFVSIYPGGSAVKSLPAMQEMQETQFDPWVRKIPLEEEMATHPAFLREKSHGQRSLVGYWPWDHRESDRAERARTHTHTHTHTQYTRSTISKIHDFFSQLSYILAV